MTNVTLELMCLNPDDYANLNLLMSLIGGELQVSERKEINRTFVTMKYDLEQVKTWTKRKGGRNKKIIVQRDASGNEILDADGRYQLGMSLVDIEKMIDEIGSVATAKRLKIGRTTLFRKLKKARENGEDYII